MKEIYLYTWITHDKYGDEQERYGFLSADNAQQALEAATLRTDSYAFFTCAHCGEHSPIGLSIFDERSFEFWDVFDMDIGVWREPLMQWAGADLEMAVRLWQLALDDDIEQLLELDELRAIVEQQELKQSLMEVAPTAAKRHSRSKSL